MERLEHRPCCCRREGQGLSGGPSTRAQGAFGRERPVCWRGSSARGRPPALGLKAEAEGKLVTTRFVLERRESKMKRGIAMFLALPSLRRPIAMSTRLRIALVALFLGLTLGIHLSVGNNASAR